MTKNPPHIALIVLDSARSDFFGCYGNSEGLTPHIDEIAKRAIVCPYNYAGGNGSAMGHTSIFSGQHPARHQMVHNLSEMSANLQMLPHLLRQFGYKSFGHLQASFIPPAGYDDIFRFDDLVYPGKSGGNGHQKSLFSLKKNLLEMIKNQPWLWSRGKKLYGQLFGDRGRVRAAASAFNGIHSIEYLTRKFQQHRSTPLFAYSTLLHPHSPYFPPSWCLKKVFGREKIDKMGFRIQLDFHGWFNGNYGEAAKGIETVKKLYKSELLYADHLVGQFVHYLKAEGLYDNTVLIITADHGEMLGEHGWINHGGTVWDEVYRVPLIISYPPLTEDYGNIEELTSNLDLVPTLFDILGVLDSASQQTTLDGFSLLKKGGVPNNRSLVIDSPPVVLPGRLKQYAKVMEIARIITRARVTRNYKYIWSSDGKESLFKFNQGETRDHNLIHQHPEIARNYLDEMKRFYQSIDGSYVLGKYPLRLTKTLGHKFGNPLIVQELKKLGYL